MNDQFAAPDRLTIFVDAIGSRRGLRRHGAVFWCVAAVLLIINVTVGGGWWSFWPLYAWGLVLAVHFFYVRSINVSDDWVEERADDLRMRSYDFDHIRDINQRIADGDYSVRPPDKRDP